MIHDNMQTSRVKLQLEVRFRVGGKGQVDITRIGGDVLRHPPAQWKMFLHFSPQIIPLPVC